MHQFSRSSAFWFRRRRCFKGFYHIWAWRPSWSCDLDRLNKLSSPVSRRLHMKFGFNRPSGFRDVWKCWQHTHTQTHTTHTYIQIRTTEAYLSYKLTTEPKGSGGLKTVSWSSRFYLLYFSQEDYHTQSLLYWWLSNVPSKRVPQVACFSMCAYLVSHWPRRECCETTLRASHRKQCKITLFLSSLPSSTAFTVP